MINSFKYIFIIIAIGYAEYILYSTGYDNGYNKANYEWTNGKLKDVSRDYQTLIESLKKSNESLKMSVQQYEQENTNLNNDVTTLRMRINKSNTLRNTNDKSNFTGQDTGEWREKINILVREFTNLAEERDAIALKYNELSDQCRMK